MGGDCRWQLVHLSLHIDLGWRCLIREMTADTTSSSPSSASTPERSNGHKPAQLPEAALEIELGHQKRQLAAARAEQNRALTEVASLRAERLELKRCCEQLEEEAQSRRHLSAMATRDADIAEHEKRHSQLWSYVFMGTTTVACAALLMARMSSTAARC